MNRSVHETHGVYIRGPQPLNSKISLLNNFSSFDRIGISEVSNELGLEWLMYQALSWYIEHSSRVSSVPIATIGSIGVTDAAVAAVAAVRIGSRICARCPGRTDRECILEETQKAGCARLRLLFLLPVLLCLGWNGGGKLSCNKHMDLILEPSNLMIEVGNHSVFTIHLNPKAVGMLLKVLFSLLAFVELVLQLGSIRSGGLSSLKFLDCFLQVLK